MKTSSIVRRATVVTCIVLVLLACWIALRWDAPPLRIVQKGTEINIDVQTLGEYPTTVNRLRLSDMNQSTVVWEVSTPHGTIHQLHEFTLKIGENPALLDDAGSGAYYVVTPQGVGQFALRAGTKYRIEIWGGKTLFSKRSATFNFGG